MYLFCPSSLKLSVFGSVCLFWENTKTTQYAEAAAGRSCDIFEALRLAALLICPLICLPVKVFSNPTPALDSAQRERIAKSGKFGLIGLDGWFWFWVKSDPWNSGKRVKPHFYNVLVPFPSSIWAPLWAFHHWLIRKYFDSLSSRNQARARCMQIGAVSPTSCRYNRQLVGNKHVFRSEA